MALAAETEAEIFLTQYIRLGGCDTEGKARANAAKTGLSNVEFRKGEIESLPVEDDSIDVAISNCVMNLVLDKDRTFREIHRVLKCGGRLAVADMAWETEPSSAIRKDMEGLVGCIGGALLLDDYVTRLKRAGFARVEVEKHAEAARKMVEVSGAVRPAGIEHLLSVNITATK